MIFVRCLGIRYSLSRCYIRWVFYPLDTQSHHLFYLCPVRCDGLTTRMVRNTPKSVIWILHPWRIQIKEDLNSFESKLTNNSSVSLMWHSELTPKMVLPFKGKVGKRGQNTDMRHSWGTPTHIGSPTKERNSGSCVHHNGFTGFL